MSLQLVTAEILLLCLKLRRANNHRLGSLHQGVVQESQSCRLVKVLDDVSQKNQIVCRQPWKQFRCVANMNSIVEESMHRSEIGCMPLDAVDAHPPVLAL